MSNDTSDEGPDDGTDDGAADGAATGADGAAPEARRKRRRRRRRPGDGPPGAEGQAAGARDPSAPANPGASGDANAPRDANAPGDPIAPRDDRPRDDRPREGGRQRRDWGARGGQRGPDASSGAPAADSFGDTATTDATAIPGEVSGAVTAGNPAADAQRGRDNRGGGRDGNRGGGGRDGNRGGGGRDGNRGGGRDGNRGGDQRARGGGSSENRGGAIATNDGRLSEGDTRIGASIAEPSGATDIDATSATRATDNEFRDGREGIIAGSLDAQSGDANRGGQRSDGRGGRDNRGGGDRGGANRQGGGRGDNRGGAATGANRQGGGRGDNRGGGDRGNAHRQGGNVGASANPEAAFNEDGTLAEPQRADDRGGNRGGRGGGADRSRGGGRDGNVGRGQGGGEQRARGGSNDNRGGDTNRGGGDNRGGDVPADQRGGAADAPRTYDAPAAPRLEQRRPQATRDDVESTGELPSIAWGSDDAGPPTTLVFPPDLPLDAPETDLEPLTHPALDAASAQLGDDIASVVGVRFQIGGRIQWCDAGDADYARGERILVDSERGQRLATVATPPTRRATRDRGLRRVIRRATEQDLRGEREVDSDRGKALRTAKDVAATLKLPLKVFRVEVIGQGRGAKLNVYYTSDERLDLREFIQVVGRETGARLELRQLGVRDEAKAVGGIGSCGLTLCCTTWLPDFVPVSIKMAKDQGLVLSPTKVAGQCGRLKCCLVYEQAAYAELRKGLPKLGKRVTSQRGEGRVVEVDVLRQRVRVSYGMGDSEVLPATEVKPLFPAGNQPRAPRPEGQSAGPAHEHTHEHEPEAEAEADEAPAEFPVEALPPTDDPSSDDHGPTDDPSSDDFQA